MSRMSELDANVQAAERYRTSQRDTLDFTCRKIRNEACDLRDMPVRLSQEQETDLFEAIAALNEAVRRLS